MDPNKVLDDLRENVQSALVEVYKATEMTPARGEDLENLLRDIAETFDNLDEWLTRGGGVPNAWRGDEQ